MKSGFGTPTIVSEADAKGLVQDYLLADSAKQSAFEVEPTHKKKNNADADANSFFWAARPELEYKAQDEPIA